MTEPRVTKFPPDDFKRCGECAYADNEKHKCDAHMTRHKWEPYIRLTDHGAEYSEQGITHKICLQCDEVREIK